MSKLRSAYTTQVGTNSVPITGTKYSPQPPPVNAPPKVTVNGVTVPWSTPPSAPSAQAAPQPVTHDRTALIVAGVLLVLFALAAPLGAWQQLRPREDAAHYANVTALDAQAAPVAALQAQETTQAPTPSAAAVYAAAPSMTLWCDERRTELTSARQVAPHARAGCVAAYGWCVECQAAWAAAHP
jgi:hypothetical protein